MSLLPLFIIGNVLIISKHHVYVIFHVSCTLNGSSKKTHFCVLKLCQADGSVCV